jgi:glycosyltransferase involved in cell wall biosynthesis
MKILQVVQKPQRRGAEIFAGQLSGQLESMGHSVRTAYLYPHQGKNGLRVNSDDSLLDGREEHYLEKVPGIHFSLLGRLSRVIGDWQPDVVQVNGGRTLKYGAAAATTHRRTPWVLIYRSIGQPGNWVRGGLHRKFYSRFIMPRVDGIVAVSAATQRALGELYDLSAPIVHIPRAVDPRSLVPMSTRAEIRRLARTPHDAPVVLYVGSLTNEKRLDRLIRIAANVTRSLPALRIWIVGEGPNRVELETQARDLSIHSGVRFLGVRDDVASYMNAADVLALTSDTEGMPGVVLEAGILRRTVVATRVGGVSECVLHEQTGLVVERNDEDGFAQSLLDILQRPDRLRTLGDAAAKWIESHFTIGRIADQYEDFYESVRSQRTSCHATR